jgi:hypothetical protein
MKINYFKTLLEAANGNPSSQFEMGLIYEHGIGVDKSTIVAVKWFKLAEDQGNVNAKIKLNYLYFNRDIKHQ